MFRRLMQVFFFIYCLAVLWLTFVHAGGEAGRMAAVPMGAHNVILFKNILHYLNQYEIHGPVVRLTFLRNLLGNLLLLLPAGYCSYLLFPLLRQPLWMWLLSLLIPGAIESTQFISGRGIWDIDDIIPNSSGWLLGCGLAAISLSLFPTHQST
jgi:glycopeptide antibiotics resistance protein